jgi:hypothetical protein
MNASNVLISRPDTVKEFQTLRMSIEIYNTEMEVEKKRLQKTKQTKTE